MAAEAPIPAFPIPVLPTPALKEWAVIVQALLAGEQIVDLRKGGIREPSRHFEAGRDRAWLYPTAEHQRAELLRPAYRRWVESAPSSPPGSAITLHGWADVVATATIREPEHLEALAGKVIWSDEYVESRFAWKRRDPLWVLVLRAYRLAAPLTVAWDERYRGCTSWVTLDGLPPDPAVLPGEPALSDVAFEGRWKGVREALPAELWS
jgi:hypothetical protein